MPDIPGVDRLVVAYDFVGSLRHAWLAVKYTGRADAVPTVVRGLVANARALQGQASAIVPIPTTGERRRHRGFDQSVLIAELVSKATGVPMRRDLSRLSQSPQTGRGRLQRLAEAPIFDSPTCSGLIVLVDDVVTTGATVASAAQAVRRGGASGVVALVLASAPMTPRPAQS